LAERVLEAITQGSSELSDANPRGTVFFKTEFEGTVYVDYDQVTKPAVLTAISASCREELKAQGVELDP
jgi:hypothetical protein